MLRDIKNDLFHILGVLESIGKIDRYISNIETVEDFFRN